MNHILSFTRKNWHLFTAAALGGMIFLCIYGIEPLRVSGIGWTEMGYGGRDITQHQAGWMFFRNSPWSFPLCKALYLGYPQGVSVAFTDSIPLAALFFKLLSPILPDHFQYFGLYTFFCFIMQGFFSAALLFHFTNNRFFAAIGANAFVISSCFLERSFRHTALSTHWLLLAALLLYFYSQKIKTTRYFLLWWLILCISLGTHPYLFGMIFGVFVFNSIDIVYKRKTIKPILFGFAIISVLLYLFGFILGLFNGKISPAEGFGIFSLNLNGLFNPKSKYHQTWSAFLQNRPVYYHQGDGIYYLGLGLIILIIAVSLFLLFKKPSAIKTSFCNNRNLLLLLILYTLFAISNKITFDDKILLEIPLPDKIFNIFSIFRASERFFFLPYYCIILTALVYLYRIINTETLPAVIICIVFLAIQTLDILPGLKDFHQYFSTREEIHDYTEEWQQISKQYHTALTFEELYDRILAFWLARNNFRTNMNITAQIQLNAYWEQTRNERLKLKEDLGKGDLVLDSETIYIIPELIEYNWTFQSQDELLTYLNQLKINYDGKANLQYLSMNLNDAIRNYWVLCPIK